MLAEELWPMHALGCLLRPAADAHAGYLLGSYEYSLESFD